jgi:AcrR family transcriptional regulator
VGHRHSRDDILTVALEFVREQGLSQLSFGRVAGRLGISDRMVVYYFPTKDDLVTAVMTALAGELQEALGAAFHTPAADARAIAGAAWPVLARPELDAVFALFFEANGLAAAGREPYRAICTAIVEAWIAWLLPHLTGTPQHRRAEAEAALALVDGLLLVRQIAGPDAADRAAGALGLR